MCHLAWFLRNNRLIERTNCPSGGPSCSNNGTLFRDLDFRRFKECNTGPFLFYVMRRSPSELLRKKKITLGKNDIWNIPFQVVRFNSENAMNKYDGVFTVPEEGIYSFSLSGVQEPTKNLLWIYLRSNKKIIGSTFGSKYIVRTTFVLRLILKLNIGDQIDLYLKRGTDPGSKKFATHFSGVLLTSSNTIDKANNHTSPVHFCVQRSSSFSIVGIILYELELVNVGNAIDINTGIFITPADGIYHFSLTFFFFFNTHF